MSIKLLLLKSGELIVSDAKELLSEDKLCGYLLNDPQLISINKNKEVFLLEESQNQQTGMKSSVQISLLPWIFLSKDNQFPIPPDWVVTIVDPIDDIIKMYEDKLNGKESEVSFTEK